MDDVDPAHHLAATDQLADRLSGRDFRGIPTRVLSNSVLALLREFPIDWPTLFEPFTERAVEAIGWIWEKREPDNTQTIIHTGIERMVIDPLEEFGILSMTSEEDSDRLLDIRELASLRTLVEHCSTL